MQKQVQIGTYKGCLHFCLYNPQKPTKLDIKLFQVTEALSGYILGFEIYTGKQSVSVADQAMPLDVTCTRTTKLVLGLLASVDLQKKHVSWDTKEGQKNRHNFGLFWPL